MTTLSKKQTVSPTIQQARQVTRQQTKDALLQAELKKQVKVRVLEELSNFIDYGEDRFLNLPINRDMKRRNELKLLRAFKRVHPHGVSVLTVIRTGAWTKGIKVDYVCDGHHRRKVALEFAKMINMPVPLQFNIVEIDGEDTIENVGKILETINVNLGTWSPKDYTSHVTKLGLKMSKDYAKFEELSVKYKMNESSLIPILGLGEYSMDDYKNKKFKINNINKSVAILELLAKIGWNDPKKNKYDAFPQNVVKRVLMKKLLSLDTKQLQGSIAKFQKFLKDNQFSYDDNLFRMELDTILNK